MSFLSKLLEVSRWQDRSFPLCCYVTNGEEKLCPYWNKKMARTFKEWRDVSSCGLSDFFFHSDHHPLDPKIEIMEKYCENCLTGIEY